jgi:hypothetical protein
LYDIWNCCRIIYVIVNAVFFGFLLFSKITQSQHDPAIWLPLQFTEHLIDTSMPGSFTYIRRSWKNFLYSSLPSLGHHKSMNKAPNTYKQYHLARQTVFRRQCKQTYSCQIGLRQTAYIEYILKCLFKWQCWGIHICNFA